MRGRPWEPTYRSDSVSLLLAKGIGRRLSESVRLEAGYMNQYLWIDEGEDRSNYLAVLNFRILF